MFVGRGANLFPNAFGGNHTNNYVDCWNFNIVRIARWLAFTNQEVIDTVNAYRARGLVVMIRGGSNADYDVYLTASQMTEVKSFLTAMANQFINDPYVWFCTYNEFGNASDYADVGGTNEWVTSKIDQWVSQNREIIAAIRATGNDNIISAPAMIFGQDILRNPNNTAQFGRPMSEISCHVAFGGQISQGHSNIVFESHPYAVFRNSGDLQYMLAYLDEMAALGRPVIFGEHSLNTANTADTTSVNANIFAARAQGRSFSNMVWSWTGGSQSQDPPRHHLTDPTGVNNGSGGGNLINSCSNPTNLSTFGQQVWDEAHGG